MNIAVAPIEVEIIPDEAPQAVVQWVQEEDATHDLLMLDSAQVQLFRTGGSTVRATVTDPQIGAERSFLVVRIARAFPLSMPDQYIGLRNGDDKDIGQLKTLEGLDAASRQVVDEELDRRYFVPKVLHVNHLKEEFGNFTWNVQTDKGPRVFVVPNMRESAAEISPNRVMVTDKDGVRYEFPDVSRLDAKSQALFVRVL